MNITELDSFNLADAVKFHDRLNPRLWDRKEHLRPEVHAKLMEIARDFQEFLGVPDLDVKDITVSGSNAAYNYTPNSDIDLHLVVDLPEADNNEVYRELFDAKKFQYNAQHNIRIGGYDVELYVQNPNEEHHSQGIYSLLRNAWTSVPKRRKADIDDISTRSKYEDLAARIDSTIADGDHDSMAMLMKKIKTMRQSGLEQNGEFGADNLAFKLLRNNGYIKKLVDARNAARDRELSLAEKSKPRQHITYGFVNESPDGVNPSTKMFLEEPSSEDEGVVRNFIDFVADRLGITDMPEIVLHTDPEWSKQAKSFGRYTPETHTLEVNLANRHIMDTLRTTAHELVHCRQNQEHQLPNEAGETGSRWENQAHAIAGVIMRDYADQNPAMFESSGYIPTNAEKNDPRFKMALSVDVRPGETGRQANKMALKTDAQGKPGLLMKTANLRESRMPEQALAESLLEELALFEEDLFEVKMTSKNLAKLARDIPGATVGLEFEMIVPRTESYDGGDMEPDYDQDQRVRDIDDCVSFFDDGDYNGRNEIRRLRENMESDFFDWKTEKLDELWNGNQGFEFFQEYLDREDPFDEDDAREEAVDEIGSQYPDLSQESDEFNQLVRERIDEKNASYYTDQWEKQGRNYDYAREEFDNEQGDDISESDWLDSQGIRYASDVESNYSHVTWPYYTSTSGDDADIKQVALEFMNYMGYDTIAVGDYHGYGGGYQLWNGSEWRKIGSNKPMDAFTVEPDGSLSGDDSGDTGLEFVSPPIPLDQIGETMKKVQQWAGENGVYTGKRNSTSMHTNISIPGYDLDKLDYLKAAILLGDEYVLRQFDRIGNTYAKPAINKVKELVNQKPEKAQELLDKMKSQLNAEASKLIHSGQTDKYTSINTKDNRIEFRSPGGDYLSIIADKPQKMIDTINRMVVVLDAAMDPNKYKEEYQKKLYKILTGQGGGREARTGAKQEMKASDKDLLNIFSRYAAGELPKQALKSFVRQAQLERGLTKGKAPAGEKYWWNVQWDANRRIEVVAGSKEVAKQVAAEEWGVPEEQLAGAVVTPLRPYKDPAAQSAATSDQGNWGFWITSVGRFARNRGASDVNDIRRFNSREEAEQFAANTPGIRSDIEIREIEPQAAAPSAGPSVAGRPSNPEGNWILAPQGQNPPVPLFRFNAASVDDANTVVNQWNRENSGEEVVVHYDPQQRYGQPPVPGSTLDRQRQRAQAAQQSTTQFGANTPAPMYEIVRNSDNEVVHRFFADSSDEAYEQASDFMIMQRWNPDDYSLQPADQAPAAPTDDWSAEFERRVTQPAAGDAAQGGLIDVPIEIPNTAPRTLTTPGQPQQQFTGEWKVVDPQGREIYRFGGVGNSQSDANRVAMDWLRRNPRQLQAGVEVLPVMG